MTTITLPPDIDERLTVEARRQGTTPEQLALDTLRMSFIPNGDEKLTPDVAELPDPLISHIGAFRTGVVDWTERHDQYLGQVLLKELRGDATQDSDG